MSRYHFIIVTFSLFQTACTGPTSEAPADVQISVESEAPPVQKTDADKRPISDSSESHPTSARDLWTPTLIRQSHLPNAYRLHHRVISGGLPEGEPGFRELASLGVKTVISVDGAKPPVELARQHGLRYVHLPHGYNGVTEQRAIELAKAVRDLPGPIYIHCHHGKHRSPAAAAIACIGAGLLQPAQGLALLRTAGTSPHYKGLYASTQSAYRLDAALLDKLLAEMPETAKVPPMAEAMVDIEETHAHLQAIERAGWSAPPDHPDLVPAHEALMLREHFTELLRSSDTLKRPAPFLEMVRQSEVEAKRLEASLRRLDDQRNRQVIQHRSLEKITNHCATCHRQYRDIPLNQ